MTRVISLCGAPLSGKLVLAAELAIKLNEKHSVIFENKLMIAGEKNGHPKYPIFMPKPFAQNYKEILSYILLDIKNREVAKENNIDFILYKDSIYDRISMIQTNDGLNYSQKAYLESILSGHGDLLPSDFIVYCEPMDMNEETLGNTAKIVRLQIDSILMQILDSKNIEFLVAKKTSKNRADLILESLKPFLLKN